MESLSHSGESTNESTGLVTNNIGAELDFSRRGASPYGNSAIADSNLESDKSCMIIYSDEKYVSYINKVLTKIETALVRNRYSPLRLGLEIGSDEDYRNKVTELIDRCQLAIIILDGLRPNVVFEFGFLKGRNKPLIVLKSKGATINIKSLFHSYAEARIAPKQFERLKNPVISIPRHLSDYAGKHITPFNLNARSSNNQNVIKVVESELKKIRQRVADQIVDTTKYAEGPFEQIFASNSENYRHNLTLRI